MSIRQITKAYERTYRDSGQTTTYVEWIGTDGKRGRTEGQASNPHMGQLLNRAMREGVNFGREVW